MSILPSQAVEEIQFYLRLHGLSLKSHSMVMAGERLTARYVCVDTGGREVILDFEPATRSMNDGQGRLGPSKLIDAGQWLQISDRLAAATNPSREDMVLASLALEQVLGFCGDDPMSEPAQASFFTPDGAKYRDTQPRGTFARYRLGARLDTYKKIVGQSAAPAAGPAAPTTGEPKLVPLLKVPTANVLEHCIHMPLPGRVSRPDLPVVAFAESTPGGYVLLGKTDPRAADPHALLARSLPSLLEAPRDLMVLGKDIAVHAGQDSAADLLLHHGFLQTVGARLNTNAFWVGVPHRHAFYALRMGAGSVAVTQFCAMVTTDFARADALGHARVSELLFLIEGADITAVSDAKTLQGASGGGANWVAAFVLAFFGGVVGMGIGIGIIASQDIRPPLASMIVLGLAFLAAAGAFALGFRMRR